MTVRYEVDEHGLQRPVEIERILISTQHRDGLDAESLIKPDLVEHVLRPILPHDLYDERADRGRRDFFYVNPTGKFVIGGPMGDTGVTGRKIIVDTYGGAAPARRRRLLGQGPDEGRPLGGVRGALRGEERRRGRARRPVPAPGRLRDRRRAPDVGARGDVRHRGTSRCRGSRSSSSEHFDLRPAAILRDLDLRRPIYAKTAAYGHFGREDQRLHLGADGQGRRAP